MRLGKFLVPLFTRIWGTPPGLEFVVHGATTIEYFQNRRLRSKFDWVADEPFLDDLKSGKVHLRQSQKDSIADTLEYLKEVVVSSGLSCSEVDRRCLATAMEIGAPLATDDGDLQLLAREFEHAVLSSQGVLAVLLKRGAVTMAKIREIAERWVKEDDLPRDFKKEFRELFGEEAPK